MDKRKTHFQSPEFFIPGSYEHVAKKLPINIIGFVLIFVKFNCPTNYNFDKQSDHLSLDNCDLSCEHKSRFAYTRAALLGDINTRLKTKKGTVPYMHINVGVVVGQKCDEIQMVHLHPCGAVVLHSKFKL